MDDKLATEKISYEKSSDLPSKEKIQDEALLPGRPKG